MLATVRNDPARGTRVQGDGAEWNWRALISFWFGDEARMVILERHLGRRPSSFSMLTTRILVWMAAY
jgi:hypothetical protein